MQLKNQPPNHDLGQHVCLGFAHVKLSQQLLRSSPENPFYSLLQVRNSNARNMPQELHHLVDALNLSEIL